MSDPFGPEDSSLFPDLLRRAREGNPLALGQLLNDHRQVLWVRARRRLPNRLNARVGPSDVVQDTILAAHQNFRQFRGQSSREFAAWLQEILHSTVRACLRRHSRKKRSPSREVPLHQFSPDQERFSSDALSAEEILIRKERADLIAGCIHTLPEESREVIHLHITEKRRFRDVGDVLGISEEAARKRGMRALWMLGKAFEEGGLTG